jgi:hypothetical protein
MWLGDTIVPWLAEWLIYYEGWRLTGTWHGNGLLPEGYVVKPEPDESPT